MLLHLFNKFTYMWGDFMKKINNLPLQGKCLKRSYLWYG